MSANTDPTNGCFGKQRFESFNDAQRIARLSAGRRQLKFRAYHCRQCAGFHYGSHVQKTRKKPHYEPMETRP